MFVTHEVNFFFFCKKAIHDLKYKVTRDRGNSLACSASKILSLVVCNEDFFVWDSSEMQMK